MLAMGNTVEMKDLRGSERRSTTPYVHGRMGVILQCDVQALAWLLVALGFNLSILTSAATFYSSRLQRLHCDLGPDRWP
jgi:hypothetical protein